MQKISRQTKSQTTHVVDLYLVVQTNLLLDSLLLCLLVTIFSRNLLFPKFLGSIEIYWNTSKYTLYWSHHTLTSRMIFKIDTLLILNKKSSTNLLQSNNCQKTVIKINSTTMAFNQKKLSFLSPSEMRCYVIVKINWLKCKPILHYVILLQHVN